MQKFLSVTLPATLALAVFLALPSMVSAQSTCGPTETVLPGDTLQEIALRCNSTVAAILTLNPSITDPDLIRVDQVINITAPAQPSDGQDEAAADVVTESATESAEESAEAPESEPATGSVEIYTVQPGDWLSVIANRFNTTIEALVAANPVITDPDRIEPGQELVVPLTSPVTNTVTTTSTVPSTDDGLNDPTIVVTPTSGPPGTLVQVMGNDFSPNTPVDVGLGQVGAEFTVIQEDVQTDATGTFTATITIPEGAESGQPFVVAIAPDGADFEAISNVFNVNESEETDSSEPSEPSDVGFDQTQIYLVAVGDEGQSGQQIGCGDSLVLVTVQIEPTLGVLSAALEQLLSQDEPFHAESGLYNALYQSDLTVEEIQIEGGEARISLSGEIVQGGACDTPRIQAQLEETVNQFASVDQVTILVNDLPLNEVLQ